MTATAYRRALFSDAPQPVMTTWLTDVPAAEFRGTEQPTASDGLGEDVEL